MSSRNPTNFIATLVVLCAGAGGCVDGGSSALAPQSGGALRIEAEALPEATLDEPYRAAVTAVSGTPPYRWSVVSGGLAPGLHVAMEGSPSISIAGTPQDRGTFEFRLRVEDAAGDRAERAMQLVVAVEDLPLRITTGGMGPIIFPEARLGQAYSAAVIAAGGFGPYRWSLSAASLPDGLQLRPSGTPDTVVLGAATELGTFSGLITVSDARGATDTKPFFGAVTRATGMLEITTTSLPTATACVPFEARVQAWDGTGRDYRWRIVGGALPAGLSLRADGTPATAIVGTALRSGTGTHSVTIKVTDSAGNTDTRTLTLDVVDTGELWSLALIGDLEVEGRRDLYLADLCGPLPTPGVRVSTNTRVDSGVSVGRRVLSPDGRRLAFGTHGDTAGVFVSEMRAGVAGPPIRVSGPGWAQNLLLWPPRFSRDSRRLAYVVVKDEQDPDGHVEGLYVVDISGPVRPNSAVNVLPQIHSATNVLVFSGSDIAFSDDSSQLAFVSDAEVDREFELWVVDLATVRARSAVRATDSVPNGFVRGDALLAVPGGARFIVAGEVLTEGVTELFLVDAAVRPPVTVRLSGPMPAGTDVLVASDQFGVDGSGSRVWYFTGQRYNAVEGIWGVDLSSPGVATQLHAPAVPGVNKGMTVGSGPGLLIRGRQLGRNPSEIFLFDLDGPPNQSLESAGITASTSTSSVNSKTAVSPDGRWIAYVDGVSRAAYVVPVDGATASPPVRVSPSGIDFDPYNTTEIVFAPDSSSVIFGAGGNLGAVDAYIVPTSGSAPGPLRRVTDVGHAGWINELFYVSPSTLMIRGNLLADNAVDAFVLNLNDPTLTPVRLTNPRDSGRSHVFGVFLP